MQILKISKKFFDSLDEEKNLILFRIYGYLDRDQFLNGVIKKLNEQYNFLHIESYECFSDEENSTYHMYNGYVSGQVNNYSEVIISFTTLYGKNGNVWFNQQVVPMITSKLETNKKFLIDSKIKKICLLTTHKSNRMTREANEIIWDSSIQMTVNFANTIGFEFVEVFPIKNLNIEGRYKSVEEIIDHTNLLQHTHEINSQFQQIRKESGILVASFERPPRGQEQKFFTLKLLAVAHLLKGKDIDLSHALEQTEDNTIKVLDEYIKYLTTIESEKYPALNIISELDTDALESLEPEESEEIIEELTPIIEGVPEYKLPVITAYNSNGKKVFKTKRKYKLNSIIKYNYLCGCDNEKHLYFKANTTKENFVDGHHMIPMEFQQQYWSEYKTNLDCTDNIIPLCPHCHGKIHKAIKEQRNEVLAEIFSKYQTNLFKVDPGLTLSKFASFYNVYIY